MAKQRRMRARPPRRAAPRAASGDVANGRQDQRVDDLPVAPPLARAAGLAIAALTLIAGVIILLDAASDDGTGLNRAALVVTGLALLALATGIGALALLPRAVRRAVVRLTGK